MPDVTAIAQSLTQQNCPTCRASIPIHSEYVTWCAQCGWNLQPQKPERPPGLFDRLYQAAGKRWGQALFNDVVRATSLKPGLTLSKVLAFGLAIIVHMMTLVFAALGVVVLIDGWPNPFTIIAGVICLGSAWVVRPQFATFPDTVASRERFPTLYKLADAIAQSLGVPQLSGIVLTWRFNAAFTQVGWRRKSIMYLGLPIWCVLGGQEQVALVAHELAHGANRDIRRGLVIGTAISSLSRWHGILRPAGIWSDGHGIQNIVLVPFNLMMLGLSEIAKLGLYLLAHLLWHNSQRAEYLADYLSAQIAGTDASLALLDKLHLGEALSLTLERATWTSRNRTFLADFRSKVAAMPEHELERVRRIEQLAGTRLNATHPPTAHRIAFLKAHPVTAPQVILSPDDAERLERELITIHS